MDTQGTVKLFDGLYVGDESSARDQELILLNRVAVVLNLTHLPNYYLHYGIQYPQVQWPCQQYRDIIDAIAQAKELGESVLIHGNEDLDRPVAAATIYLMERQLFEYEERFRWSLFKTLEFVSSRIEGLTFSSDCFEMLKKHELEMLNEQSRLSYNWQQRPNDTEQLILRNTYLNATHKDKGTVSTPSKPKIKEKRRITWKISAIEEVRVVPSPLKIKDQASSIRNQVVLSVRKILNKDENSKNGSGTSISDQRGLPLKKYKSTYTLASLSSLQRLQKLQEVPIVSLNLTEADENKRSKSQISIKRSKTEGSETFAVNKNQPQITISLRKESEKKSLGHRRISDSLKKLKTKQEAQINEKISSNNLFYQKIR